MDPELHNSRLFRSGRLFTITFLFATLTWLLINPNIQAKANQIYISLFVSHAFRPSSTGEIGNPEYVGRHHVGNALDRILAPIAQAQTGQDLQITKSHTGEFAIGASEVYNIQVRSVGNEVVTGTIRVRDLFPAGVLTPTQVSGDGWNTNILAGSANYTVTAVYPNPAGLTPTQALPSLMITVTVGRKASSINANGVITNTARVFNSNDGNTENNHSRDRTVITSADLGVGISFIPTNPVAGELITFTLTITNNGPSSVSGVLVNYQLPEGISYVTHTLSQPGTYNNTSGAWVVGTVMNQARAILRIRGQIAKDRRGQTLANIATGLTSDLYDYNPDNNSASAPVLVSNARISGRVVDRLTQTAIVTATVVVTDSLNVRHEAISDANGRFVFTEITPFPLGTFRITASKKDYFRSATLSYTLGDTALDPIKIDLDTIDLQATKDDLRSTVNPGETIQYSISIRNQSYITASQVVITDVLSSYLTYVSDTSGVTSTVPTVGTRVYRLSRGLGPFRIYTFNLVARVTTPLPIGTNYLTNTIKVSTRDPEVNKANNIDIDVNTSTTTASPNPSITLSVSPESARIGKGFTFLVGVTNTGSVSMSNARVSITFPSVLDIISVTTSKGTYSVSGVRSTTITIGNVDPNESITISIGTQINDSATTTSVYSSSATLSYTFGSSSLSSTSNTVSYRVVGAPTLPPTGGVELNADQPAGFVLAIFSGALLALLSLAAFTFGLLTRNQNPAFAGWGMRMGLLLVGAAAVFGLAAWVLQGPWPNYLTALISPTASITEAPRGGPGVQPTVYAWLPPSQLPGAYETLPDYPIPTPSIQPIPGEPEKPADTSAAERIIIPALDLDTEVKYVPFDGISWLIDGLKQEVAWLGNTSWPGLGGNTALAGHVTLFNGQAGPFRYLSELRQGDEIWLYTGENIYYYQARDLRVVADSDMSVVEPSDRPQLTLITCTGWDANARFYLQRLVVFADLVKTRPLRTGAAGQ